MATTDPNPLTLIEQAIKAKIAPDQLGELYKLAQRWRDDRAAEAFATAITEFQAECPVIRKARQADVGKYVYWFADYSDVMAGIRDLLRKHRIVVTFATESAGGSINVVCRVRVGTHVEETPLTVPVPNVGVNDTQRFGAAVSYAKRYALCAALNIVVADDVDDDASRLAERVSQDQADEIARLVVEAGRDQAKFLAWAGVDDLRDLPLAKYREAKSMLAGSRPKQKAGAK